MRDRSVSAGNAFHDPAGIPDGDNVRRDIAGHHGSGADGDVVPYRNPGQDGDAAADPDIVPDGDRFGPFLPAVPLDGVGTVAGRIDTHIGADEAVVADGDRGLVQYSEVKIGKEAFPYPDLLPVVAEKGLG